MKRPDYPLTEKEFVKIYSKVPRFGVEIVVKSGKGILLTLRSVKSYKGLWHIPGGTLFCGETVLDCVGRVAKEELGVEVSIIKSLGYAEYDERKERGFGWTISLQFLCKIESGKPRGSFQAAKVGFFKKIPKNTIPQQADILRIKLGLK